MEAKKACQSCGDVPLTENKFLGKITDKDIIGTEGLEAIKNGGTI